MKATPLRRRAVYLTVASRVAFRDDLAPNVLGKSRHWPRRGGQQSGQRVRGERPPRFASALTPHVPCGVGARGSLPPHPRVSFQRRRHAAEKPMRFRASTSCSPSSHRPQDSRPRLGPVKTPRFARPALCAADGLDRASVEARRGSGRWLAGDRSAIAIRPVANIACGPAPTRPRTLTGA